MEQDMEWKGKYKSELLMVCHMEAKAQHEIGLLNDKEMREYDRDCLVSPSRAIKTSKGMSIPNQKSVPIYAAAHGQR